MQPNDPRNGIAGRPEAAMADTAGEAKRDFTAATETARQDLDAIKDKAAEDVRAIRHEAEARIGDATEKAKGFAEDQKGLAAGQIEGVAQALSRVAEELEGDDKGAIARYARDIAGGAERLSSNLRDKDVDQLMTMAQDFGRRQPVAFLGAAALIGFAASRFALASAHRSAPEPRPTTSSTTARQSWQDDDALTPSEDRFQSGTQGGTDNVYGR
ncbi:MAG: hypothetical protein ACO1OK_02670 [Devosia sp.]